MIDPAIVAEFERVRVEDIHPAEDNLRRSVGDLSDLGSVATLGVLEPLLLTPRRGGGYTIVAGHRRHAAAVAAGLAEIPAMVRPYTESERVEVMLVENLQRRDLDPIDEALGYRRLLDLGLRQLAIAARLGVSQSHVSKRLSLLSLPAPALEALDSGGISLSDALELTKLAKHPERLEEAMRQGVEEGAVAEAVHEELEELRAEEARAASLRELEAQGVKVVKAPEWGWYESTAKPLDQLRLDAAQHAQETCHGAAVMTDGRIVVVRRSPENHATPAEVARMRALTESERAQRTRDKGRREAAKAREAHWRELVAGESLAHGAVDFVLREMLRDASSRGTTMAAGWLGLEAERDQWGYPRYGAAIAAYAAQGPEQLRRAALACALGQVEEVFRTPWAGGSHDLVHVTDLLEATGYALTQVEIDRVTSRPDDEVVAAGGEEPWSDGGAAVEEDDVDQCRVCGCTEDEPCEDGCSWVLGELCSRCFAEEGLLLEGDQGEGRGEA